MYLLVNLLPAGTGFRGPLKSPETLAKEAEEARQAELAKLDGEESYVEKQLLKIIFRRVNFKELALFYKRKEQNNAFRIVLFRENKFNEKKIFKKNSKKVLHLGII